MDASDLQHMNADGETLRVEFKHEAGAALRDRELLEGVVCFAHAEGGHVCRVNEMDMRGENRGQAYRLLRRLISSGKLRPEGAMKGRRYLLAPGNSTT